MSLKGTGRMATKAGKVTDAARGFLHKCVQIFWEGSRCAPKNLDLRIRGVLVRFDFTQMKSVCN